jgi:cell surface protein SprA
MGGPPVEAAAQEESARRSVYFYHSNNSRNLFLTMVDEAPVKECYRREQSVVPQQAMAMSNSRLDQSNAYGTGGQKEITIQPSIDYVVNKRVSLKFFFDQRRVTPYISTSAPITNTRAGVNVRISLAQ